MSKDKINKVLRWPRPQNIKDVRAFLGLCAYVRIFIANFAHKSLILSEL